MTSAIRLSCLSLLGLLTASAASAQAGVHTVTPCRLLDTRQPTAPLGGPALLAAHTRTFPAAGHCGVPDNATAVFLNVTVVAPTAPGYLALFPTGTPLPGASALNYAAAQTRGNNGVFTLGTSGQLDVFLGQASGTADALVDVAGYTLIDGPTGPPPPPTPPPPMPLISRFPGVRAFASNDLTGTAGVYGANRARDNVYYGYATFWRAPYPGWVAYDLSTVPPGQRGQVMVAFYNESFGYGGIVGRAGGTYSEPGAYAIEGNSAAGGSAGAPTSGWVPLVSVTGNTVHSRSHLLDLTGYNWIRFNATVGNPDNEVQNTDVEIKLEVWDAHLGNTNSWAFLGDSVTAGGMRHDKSAAPNFAQVIDAALPGNFPMYENAGNGFDGAQDFGLIRLNTLFANSQARYIAISYGQNDAGGASVPTDYRFYNAYKAMADAVRAAGRIPVIPTISWTGRHPMQDILGDPVTGSEFTLNRQLTKLKDDYRAQGNPILEGPDLWTYFKNHPDLIVPGDDHPTDAGYVAMQTLWAQAAIANVYSK